MTKLHRMGVRMVPIYAITVQFLPSEEDWEFVFIDAGNGKKQMAVF